MRRFASGLMITVIVLAAAGRCCSAGVMAAAVAGTVRDAHGTPQMGAMVELLRADATSVAVGFSDNHGRYILPEVRPGSYQLRATAAFFVPALRSHLRLEAGSQAIVNLTMSTLFEAENWLPAQRRRADEPVDDWKWTLRSTASRPLLRLVDPEDGVSISSSSEHSHAAEAQGRVSVMNGDGAFGDGGMHQALLLDRTLEGGDGAVLRADVGDSQPSYGLGPSMALSAGYERRSAMGATRLLSSFQSHPELTNGISPGFQVMQVGSAHQMALGDAVLIDVGTLLSAERLQAIRIEALPYAHVTVRPGDQMMIEYKYSTGRELQSADDLDRLKPALTVLTDANGRPLTHRGRHNEISVSRKMGHSVMSVGAYSDRFSHGAIVGGGAVSRATLQQAALVADPTTGTFEMATSGYNGQGVSATFLQTLTPGLSAWAEYGVGTALRSSGGVPSLTGLSASLSPQTVQAASLALRGRILHTGTSLRAEYRWQPARTLTQVNAYNSSQQEAFLSFYVRQRLWCGKFLPQGVDAVVEATNLLQQGYQPVVSPDGSMLFLAQVPRAVQGGLAFNF